MPFQRVYTPRPRVMYWHEMYAMMPFLRPTTNCIQAWTVEIIELGDHHSIPDATHVSRLTCITDVPACGPQRA
jgi:hypothetical protein